jgi:diguanylate cyclase (GGDEF)-like protein
VHQATHDPLTELPNRALLQDRLVHGVASSARSHETFALLVADLDRFKEVNDTLGHPAGDRLLQEVARRLSRADAAMYAAKRTRSAEARAHALATSVRTA